MTKRQTSWALIGLVCLQLLINSLIMLGITILKIKEMLKRLLAKLRNKNKNKVVKLQPREKTK
jgi:hypothetical protein